jgi:hypothetical protein
MGARRLVVALTEPSHRGSTAEKYLLSLHGDQSWTLDHKLHALPFV